MNERLVFRPPEQVEADRPMIFLAGPIQGARNWQADAIEFIYSINPDTVIATPRRDSFNEGFDYDEQVDWETEYLRKAGERGVVLFWLARENVTIPGRPFAKTTGIEFGEWMARHELAGAKLVVGIEEGYPSARYVKRRLESYPDIPRYDTLEETCLAAINALK